LVFIGFHCPQLFYCPRCSGVPALVTLTVSH